jgi:signal peptidase I
MESAGNNLFLDIASTIISGGNNVSFVARGRSMSPFIRDGDTVIVSPAERYPRIGDVVLFTNAKGNLLLHRVTGKTPEGVRTKGDAWLTDDGYIPYKNIIGRAVRVSGRGFNYHLKFPFNFIVGKGLLQPIRFRKYPRVLSLLKKASALLG